MTLQSRLQFLANAPKVSEAEMQAFVRARGWHTWYNDAYWVHPRYESTGTDYTQWGTTLEEAYRAEAGLYAEKAPSAPRLIRAPSAAPAERIRSDAELRAIRAFYARKRAA